MKKKSKFQSNTLSTGLAMFSMFFGAGNVVFPLAMGQHAQDKNLFAILGLLITAVGVPFLGLVSMTLFDGNYKHYFSRVGKIPGFLIALFIMALIGPFGAMPRVIALSYSTANIFFPNISLIYFSIVSCLIVYLFTYKRSRILDILGYVLTPLLLITLIILIIMGVMNAPEQSSQQFPAFTLFLHGLQEGYNTMDLMGAFFFSSIIILCLKQELHPQDRTDFRKLIKMTLKASGIGAFLLSMVYIGSSYLAAYNSDFLASVPKNEIFAHLAIHILGSHAAFIAIMTVALACLTTAIALAAVFAEFIHEDLALKKVSYNLCLIATLVATFLMSTLDFSGIMGFLEPILVIVYPALIVLSFVNILYKLYGFKPVLLPVALTFTISLALFVYNFTK